MSLTFYYAPMSTASITQLVLEELELPCEKVKLDLRAKDTQKPEFLKLNPNGKVPVLVHEGVAIWESAAITMYLGETFGVEKGLYPAQGPRRGEAMKWIAWANVTLGGAMSWLGHNTGNWVAEELKNPRAAEAARAEVEGCLKLLDQALEGKSFLLGDYSLADTHLSSVVDWVQFTNFELTRYPNLNAWHARCHARPSFGRFMASMQP